MVLAPLRNKSAVTVAHAIVSHLICPYTTPGVLLNGNGTEFNNQILADICSQYNIKHTFITAHHPASNGLVERTNMKVFEILRHLAGHLHKTWEDWISQVAASASGSVNSSTGKTPHYIIFGYDKRLPYDVLLKSPSLLYNPDDYSKLELHSFRTIHASVREKLKTSREEMTQRQHLHATPITLDVGDSVMKRSPERSCKLAPKFIGPFLVTAKLHGNKFKVLDPCTSLSEVVHADRLKKRFVLLFLLSLTLLSFLTCLPVILPVPLHQLPALFLFLSALFLHLILYIARSCGLPFRCNSSTSPSPASLLFSITWVGHVNLS